MPVEAKPLFRPEVLRAPLSTFRLPPNAEAERGKLTKWAEMLASGMSMQLYLQRAFVMIDFPTFVPATLKTTIFGFIIATASSYLGFNASQGTEGVGRASTQSVVLSSILLIVVNVLLVQLIFVLFPAVR